MRQASATISGIFNSRTEAPAFAAARAACCRASAPPVSGGPAKSCVTTPMRGTFNSAAFNSLRPVIAASAIATSSTSAANRPTVSSVQEKHLTPTGGNNRYDGLIAATPQNEAGRITEPPVCVPTASGIMPAATAAAEPDDDPPGVWPRLRGLSVGVGSFAAKAVVVVLPTTVAPASLSSITTGASARGWLPL